MANEAKMSTTAARKGVEDFDHSESSHDEPSQPTLSFPVIAALAYLLGPFLRLFRPRAQSGEDAESSGEEEEESDGEERADVWERSRGPPKAKRGPEHEATPLENPLNEANDPRAKPSTQGRKLDGPDAPHIRIPAALRIRVTNSTVLPAKQLHWERELLQQVR